MTTMDSPLFEDEVEDVVEIGDTVEVYGQPGTWVVVDERDGWLDLVGSFSGLLILAHESEVKQ